MATHLEQAHIKDLAEAILGDDLTSSPPRSKDARKIREPKAQALCEATAEVLIGAKNDVATLPNTLGTGGDAVGPTRKPKTYSLPDTRKSMYCALLNSAMLRR
jgi:hypothetical protein